MSTSNKNQNPSGVKGGEIDLGGGTREQDAADDDATAPLLFSHWPASDRPTNNNPDNGTGPDFKDQVRSVEPPLPQQPQQQGILPPDAHADDTPTPPVDAPADGLASNPQPSTTNDDDNKMAPRRTQLKKPPKQVLPTVKDQARSILAASPAADSQATTHQPTTENAGYNLLAVTDGSTKDSGPDYKDQIRTVKPPPRRPLPSAEGVPVSSIHEEPSTVIAVVIETLDDSAAAAAVDDDNAVEEQPQQRDEELEPPENGPPPKVRKHRIWAVTLVVVLAGVVVAVVVALNTNSPPAPTVSPTPFAQETKLTASDGTAGDVFGYSVAIAGDTIVVGATLDDTDNGQDSGSAYVFTGAGTTWTEQAKLTASDGAASDDFGISVAIAGDTIVVGAYRDDIDNNNTNSGSAYVFTRTGTTWTEQANLMASDGASSDRFGISVSIAGDTIVVGAHQNDDNGTNSGSAYVFTHSGATWTEQAKLLASDGGADDEFGISVAIAGDTIVVGGDDDSGSSSGSAYVYTRTGTTWTEQAKLTASDGAAGDEFGHSVAVVGETIVVGARLDDDNGTNSGSAYVFTGTGTAWTEQAKLTASDGAAFDEFGTSVAIAGDNIVVGAYRDDDNGDRSGSAYVYVWTGSTWTEEAKLTAGDGVEFDHFGWSVATAGDTIVVGARRDDTDNGIDSGSAYIYDLN